ncbi:MAG: hypothetical protein HZA53_06635 [Planctomycetes bacterium]|nr:hypothetical protein [Planctomycetota bacterium]
MIARLARHLFAANLPVLVGPLLGLTSVLAFRSTEELFFDLDEEHLAFVQFGWFTIGLVLGAALFFFEQTPANREIALQRGSSVRALFWSRAVASLALAVTIWLGALSLGTAVHLVGPNSALVTLGSTARLAAVGASTLAGFGIGAWLTTLRGTPWRVSFVAVLATGAAILVEFLLVLPSTPEPAPSVARYVGAQFALAALALVAASRGYLLGHDPDRPVRLDAQLGRAALVAGAIATLIVAVLPELQETIARGLRVPSVIGRAKDGSYVVGALVAPRLLVPVDGAREERRTPVEIEEVVYRLGFAPSWNADPREYAAADGTPIAYAQHDFRLGAETHRLLFHPVERLILDSSSGRLDFARVARPWDAGGDAPSLEPTRCELARPDGRRFGRRPTVVGGSHVLGWMDYDGKLGPLVLGDLDDGTLWRVHLRDGTPRLEAVPLPDGDRCLGWGWSAAVVRERGEDSLRELAGQLDAVVLRGERGRYAFDANGVVGPTTEEVHPWGREAHFVAHSVHDEDDPFRGRVEIAARATSPAFTYDFAPRTLREKLPSTLCPALSLLRPPIALDRTFEGLGHGQASRAVCRPIATFVFALVLAVLVAGTLARRGAEAARVAAWSIVVLLLGFPAAITFVLLERRSAFAPAVLEASYTRIAVLEGLAPET